MEDSQKKICKRLQTLLCGTNWLCNVKLGKPNQTNKNKQTNNSNNNNKKKTTTQNNKQKNNKATKP